MCQPCDESGTISLGTQCKPAECAYPVRGAEMPIMSSFCARRSMFAMEINFSDRPTSDDVRLFVLIGTSNVWYRQSYGGSLPG